MQHAEINPTAKMTKEETKTEAKADDAEDVELQVFIAASLSKVMDEVATEYQKDRQM